MWVEGEKNENRMNDQSLVIAVIKWKLTAKLLRRFSKGKVLNSDLFKGGFGNWVTQEFVGMKSLRRSRLPNRLKTLSDWSWRRKLPIKFSNRFQLFIPTITIIIYSFSSPRTDSAVPETEEAPMLQIDECFRHHNEIRQRQIWEKMHHRNDNNKIKPIQNRFKCITLRYFRCMCLSPRRSCLHSIFGEAGGDFRRQKWSHRIAIIDNGRIFVSSSSSEKSFELPRRDDERASNESDDNGEFIGWKESLFIVPSCFRLGTLYFPITNFPY